MKRIVINFKKFIQDGKFDKLNFETSNINLSHIYQTLEKEEGNNFNQTKQLETNNLTADDVLFLVKGGILEYRDRQYIIQDIGYDVIKDILRSKYDENVVKALDNINFS